MVKAGPNVKQVPLVGIEYRRWLAENGDAPAYVSRIEPADQDEIDYCRRASKDADAPAPETDTPERIRARRLAYENHSPAPGRFTDIVGGWLESYPHELWLVVINPDLASEDDEPLGATDAEERAAIMMEANRDRAVRKIWRLTGEMVDTSLMLNEDVWDWFDELRYYVQCYKDAVAREARRRRVVA